jgi:lipopolysaccharide cholinephosphotransferase
MAISTQQLERVHAVLFQMLCDLDQLLKKLDIRYWIDAGTLLGAVRHGGFIPWDDDIDICVLRDDYPKLIKAINGDAALKHKFLLPLEDLYPYIKFVDRSVMTTEHVGIQGYLSIDIFPFEPYRSKYVLERPRWALSEAARKKRLYRLRSRLGMRLSAKQMVLVYLLPVSVLDRMFGIRPAESIETAGGYRVGRECFYFPNRLIPHHELFPLTSLPFHGKNFPAPKKYRDYLHRFYGDFERLPEPAKQTGHLSEVAFAEQ